MNTHRGEVTVNLGEPLVLRPTFAALAEIEGKVGCSLITLARRMANGETTVTDIQTIIVSGLRGAGTPVPADLPQRLETAGVLNLIEPLLTFIIGALTGESKNG